MQTAQANLSRDEAALTRSQELKERGFLQPGFAGHRPGQPARLQRQPGLGAAPPYPQTQTRLAQATVRAPVAGLVIRRSVTRGQIVSAGTELFRIVRDGRLELDAQVPETELALVRAGHAATVVFGSGRPDHGPGSHRHARGERHKPARHRPGRTERRQRVTARHVRARSKSTWASTSPTITVPTASILRESRSGVFVLTTTTMSGSSRWSWLPARGRSRSVTGLPVGSRVVVQGAGFLGDGDHVNVVAPLPRAATCTRTGTWSGRVIFRQISSWSIKNPIPIILLFILLTSRACSASTPFGSITSQISIFRSSPSPSLSPARPRPRWKSRSPA